MWNKIASAKKDVFSAGILFSEIIAQDCINSSQDQWMFPRTSNGKYKVEFLRKKLDQENSIIIEPYKLE